jgi:hypothetical protein
LNWPNRILQFGPPEEASIREQIRQAKGISVSGVSLFRFVPMFFEDIKQSLGDKATQALGNGASLNLILANPYSAAVEMAAFRADDGITAEVERKRIITTVTYLGIYLTQYPDAKIKVRVCPYLVPFSIRIFVPSDPRVERRCRARLTPFKTPSLNAPRIISGDHTDAKWFQYFSDQFQRLWEASDEIDPRDPHFPGEPAPQRGL